MNMRHLSTLNPPEGLLEAVFARIELAKVRAARLRLAVSSVVASVALAALYPALRFAAQEFSASGFSDYLSLILSDTSALAAHWQEFALSLVESIPVFSITLALGTIILLLGAIKTASNYSADSFSHKHLTA
jgi:uncharacterized membrane protein